MISLDPRGLGRRERNNIMNGLVYPRPIAWVSTVSAGGARNLAPFSFFNAFSFSPPTVGIGPGSRRGINKDTLANIRATGEFVVNLVSRRMAETANLTSADLSAAADEWDLAGVQPIPSDGVLPARVAEAPAAFECEVHRIVDLGTDAEPSNSLIIGRVTRVHVVDGALGDDFLPRPEALDLVGRMGGDLWIGTAEPFVLPRPATNDERAIRALGEDLRSSAR